MATFLPNASDKLVFLDIDISESHAKYLRAAEFVEATDLRYNFSHKDILKLGGRELQSVKDFYALDYDWSSKGPILIKPQPTCRVIIKLYEESSPLACENFEALCTGNKGKAKSSGLPLHFKGIKFHRIVPDFIIQGGDIVMQNGSGGESVFGKKFKDERGGLIRKHDRAGIVSMCNSGKNSNTSQFFVTLREGGCAQCDGKHVVFGEVVSGLEVFKAVEAGVVDRGGGEEDAQAVVMECGLWDHESMLAQGYWAPNGLFLPVPVSTDEPSTTASSSVGKSTKTQTSTSPSSLHDVHIDVDTVKTAISRHIEAIEIPPTAVVERHKAGKRGKRRALVVVLAAKPIALSKFQSALLQLGGDGGGLEVMVDVVYTLDVDEVIRIVEACFSFNYDCNHDYSNDTSKEHNKTLSAAEDSGGGVGNEGIRIMRREDSNTNNINNNACSEVEEEAEAGSVYLLAGVVVGSTVLSGAQQQVLEACRGGSYAVIPSCCKPSEVLQYLLLQ